MAGMIGNKIQGEEELPQEEAVQDAGPALDPAQEGLAPEQAVPGEAQQQELPEEGEASDEDVDAVITGLMEFLYEKGAVEDAIGMIQGAESPAKGLADATYAIISMFDEQSDGNAPVEALVAGAADALAKIAEDYEKKTKTDIPDSEVARAAQIMLVRFANEAGVDASEMGDALEGVDLSQAKDQLAAATKEGV